MQYELLLDTLDKDSTAHAEEVLAVGANDAEAIAVDVSLVPDTENPYLLRAPDLWGTKMDRNIRLVDGKREIPAIATYVSRGPQPGWVLRTDEVWGRPSADLFPDSAALERRLSAVAGQAIDRLRREGPASQASALYRAAFGGPPLRFTFPAHPQLPVDLSKGLSPDQRRAVPRLLCGPLTTLLGVPGAGKTATLATAIVHAALSGHRVVCVAPSDAATTVLTMAIMRAWARVGTPSVRQLQRRDGQQLVSDRYRVITATTAMLLSRALLETKRPDLLVIDEASMIGPMLFVALLNYGARQVVLAGDPLQLPPVVISSDHLGMLRKSALHWTGAEKRHSARAPSSTDTLLDGSHRVPAVVTKIVATGWPTAVRMRAVPRSPDPLPRSVPAPVTVLSTRALHNDGRRSHRQALSVHTQLWVRLAERLDAEGELAAGPLMVLTPYRTVRESIRAEARSWRSLHGRDLPLEAMTLHAAQGSTARLVGLDLFPSLPYALLKDQFLGEERPGGDGAAALLVGITRASVATIIACPWPMQHVPRNTALGRLIYALPADVPWLDTDTDLVGGLTR